MVAAVDIVVIPEQGGGRDKDRRFHGREERQGVWHRPTVHGREEGRGPGRLGHGSGGCGGRRSISEGATTTAEPAEEYVQGRPSESVGKRSRSSGPGPPMYAVPSFRLSSSLSLSCPSLSRTFLLEAGWRQVETSFSQMRAAPIFLTFSRSSSQSLPSRPSGRFSKLLFFRTYFGWFRGMILVFSILCLQKAILTITAGHTLLRSQSVRGGDRCGFSR